VTVDRFNSEMKYLIFILALTGCVMAFAQKEVTLKAGTVIPIKNQNAFRAVDVEEGQMVKFIVSRDVNVDGVTAIPYGSEVKGIVTQAKRSSWWGTRGRLRISLQSVVAPDETEIPLQRTSDVEIKGVNHTAWSVLLFCFVALPACAICGGKAEMPAGYEMEAKLASTTTVKVK